MPIDMPLEKLKEYKGINPKPADFDAYWERGLAEISQIQPRVKVFETGIVSRTAEICDLVYDSVGGAKVRAQYLRRKDLRGKAPVVLLFHGYEAMHREYFDKLAFVNEGFIVLAMDCRGQNGKSTDPLPAERSTGTGHIIRGLDEEDPDCLYFRNVYLDTVQLVRVAKQLPNVDTQNIFVKGASQGGGLAVACAALCGKDIRKIAPSIVFLSDFKRVFEMDMMRDAYGELKTYIRDRAPVCGDEERIWNRLGYIDIHNLAPRVTAEVLWGLGMIDTVCPPSTQFAAFNQIGAKKEMIIYSNHGHEALLPFFSDRVLNFFNK